MWPLESKENKLPYTNPNRLADVMALIQLLALHKCGHRSDKGLTDEMQGPLLSGSTWKYFAHEDKGSLARPEKTWKINS